MIVSSILYSRVIKDSRNGDYSLLFSFEKPVVQKTCYQHSSLSIPTRVRINTITEEIRKKSNALEIVDVTDPGTKKQLIKLFGETKIE